jgi:hypothetical protein
MCSPCITIQVRDTQHSLVGLGPPRDRTPTVGALGRGVPTSFSHHFFLDGRPRTSSPVGHGDLVREFRVHVAWPRLRYGPPPAQAPDRRGLRALPAWGSTMPVSSFSTGASRQTTMSPAQPPSSPHGGCWDSPIRRLSARRQPRFPH